MTEELLRGPRPGDADDADVALRSQIPDGVRLEDVSEGDGGTVTVELSDEFDDGLGAAAATRSADQDAELAARVGQLTYTLTQLDGVESVRVLVDGQPVEPAASSAPTTRSPPRDRRRARTRGGRRARTRAPSSSGSRSCGSFRVTRSTGSRAIGPSRR